MTRPAMKSRRRCDTSMNDSHLISKMNLRGVLSGRSLGWLIFRPPVLGMGMHRTLRMVGGVLRSLDRGRFQGLVGIGQLLHAFFRSLGVMRELLWIARLAGAFSSHLSRVASQVIGSRFIILPLVSWHGTLLSSRALPAKWNKFDSGGMRAVVSLAAANANASANLPALLRHAHGSTAPEKDICGRQLHTSRMPLFDRNYALQAWCVALKCKLPRQNPF